MGQIIFINPFRKSQISGGIKTTYHHAIILRELGFAVAVYQPEGAPSWCGPQMQALVTDTLAPTADDVLVFPETLNGWLPDAARRLPARRKVMFCQSHNYMLHYRIDAAGYRQLGFHSFVVPSEIAKTALERILKLSDISVVPCFIDGELFHPREKVAQIVTMPRKWPTRDGYPGHAGLLRTILHQKYPQLRPVPWQFLEDKSEQDVAEIMGCSSVFLSLAYMESFGLAALEAMASGCVVVGYHGYGGLEYATPENGIWVSPEYLEDVADGLARAVLGVQGGDAAVCGMREAGIATALRFDREQTKAALWRVYGALF